MIAFRAPPPPLPAACRYDISHPVVNDAAMALWGALGVSSWPTVAVVSPRGRLLAMLSGEGHGQDLQVGQMRRLARCCERLLERSVGWDGMQ